MMNVMQKQQKVIDIEELKKKIKTKFNKQDRLTIDREMSIFSSPFIAYFLLLYFNT